MKFVHPEILWGLTAVAIPIIVHLFNFRKFKKVLFSNVAFLDEIQQETRSKSKLKHLLILAARILAITCLVFAFAQPYIPAGESNIKTGDRAVSIYIDNSFSNEAKSEAGMLLDIAKNKAIQIVEAHQPSDRFQLVTNDFEGRHQRLVGIEEMVQWIQEVGLSPSVKKIDEVIARQNDILLRAPQDIRLSYLLTDLQENVMNLEDAKIDSLVSYRIVPGNAILSDNLAIDSIWFSSPIRQLNQVEKLFVRIRNFSENKKEGVNVSLRINGSQKSVAAVDVEPEGYTDLELSYTNSESGFKSCELTLDDYPITFDNTYFFNYRVAEQIRILHIHPSAKDPGIRATDLVFADDPYFQLTSLSENAVDYGSFGQNDLIVVNGLTKISSGLSLEIGKFIQAGGTVLLIPAPDADIPSYNDLFAGTSSGQITGKMQFGFDPGNPVNFVDYDHYLLKGVIQKKQGNNEKTDYPNTGGYFRITLDNSTASDLVRMQSGDPFFIVSRSGNGQFMSFAVSTRKEDSNILNHSLFPTLLLRAAESSIRQKQFASTLGRDISVSLPDLATSGESTFRLKGEINEGEIIPEHRSGSGKTEVFIPQELRQAGQYQLLLDDSLRDILSFNFDRRESDMKALRSDDIEDWIHSSGFVNVSVIRGDSESIGKIASDLNEGRQLWHTMIIWTLIFLAIEILLIKYLK